MCNVPLNIFLLNNGKNRMLADFYIPKLSNDMKIAVQKNYFWVKFCTEVSKKTASKKKNVPNLNTLMKIIP